MNYIMQTKSKLLKVYCNYLNQFCLAALTIQILYQRISFNILIDVSVWQPSKQASMWPVSTNTQHLY